MELNRRRVKFILCLCSAKVDIVRKYDSTTTYVVTACRLGTYIFSYAFWWMHNFSWSACVYSGRRWLPNKKCPGDFRW